MTARRRRWPWILLAVLVLVPVAGFLALRAFVNPEALRPRLVAAVEQATGRDFQVGEIGLALSLVPTLELRDIALANLPGGSRPAMLTARRAEVRVALLPLLSRRVEVERVELEAPDLLLETVEGRGNWEFAPAQPAPGPAQAGAPSAPSQPLALDIGAIEVSDARIAWRLPGSAETLEIPRLVAAAPLAGPTTAEGTLRVRGQEVALRATTGALPALGGAAPWPYEVRLGLAGGEVGASGQLGPGAAWTAAAEARFPDLARLAPLLPDVPLPPLREVSATAKLAGTGGELTAAEGLALRIGATDLAMLQPGLRLARAEVSAPRLDAPLAVAAEATLNGAPLRLSGTAGTPALIAGRANGPLPVDLRLGAATAEATIRGTVRDPRGLAGVDLALAARVPDLAALSPLAGTPLPAIRDLTAEARLTERTPGFAGGAHLRDIAIASPPAAARGELTFVIAERPALNGRLDVARLDVDAIRAAMPAPPAAPAPAAPPAAPAAPAARDGRVIPDVPLPVGALRTADADLTLAVAQMTAGGAAWRDLQARLRLAGGRARIEPFSVNAPGGAVSGTLALDAAQPVPALALSLRAPGVDLAALQRALGQPVRVSGTGEIEAELRGAGAGLRQVAATAAGHLGLAVVDGSIPRAALGGLPPALLNAVFQGGLPAGDIALRCLALRSPIADGVARVETLYADGSLGQVAGGGTVSLGAETLALRLVAALRTAAVAVRAPITIQGSWTDPRVTVSPASAVAAGIGAFLSQQATPDRTLQGLAETLGGGGAAPAPLGDCGTALAAARGGRQGTQPATAAAPAQPEPAAPGGAAQPAQPAIPGLPPQIQAPLNDLLRGLGRPRQ